MWSPICKNIEIHYDHYDTQQQSKVSELQNKKVARKVVFYPEITPIKFKAKHLRFELRGYHLYKDGRKIDAYGVVNKHDDFNLGSIEWLDDWNRYAFFPNKETCYEEDCMRDMSRFCAKHTRKIKNEKYKQ